MKDDSFYTELTYKHKSPEDFGPTTITHKVTVWDTNMEDMFNMFFTILMGAGFTLGSYRQYIKELAETFETEKVPEDE